MAKKIYDVIVIGTGGGGGMAIKTLCEASLKVCALKAGKRLNPEKDFRYHRMPWDMKFRGLDDPKRRGESFGYMDNEYTRVAWDHEIPFTVAPGTKWMWPRCNAVGGKTNFWGRSSARFTEIDFRAASLDGYDVEWPFTYDEISPFYTRVEKMIGVASTVQNRPSNPDGTYLPPFKFRCLDFILQAGCEKVGVPYLPDRCAQLTQPHEGHPACHFCGAEVLRAAGGVLEGSGDSPEIPGFSLHEAGTCRMGNDPKNFVTNRFGQAHDVPNLYVCDASVFLNCTDKTTTISILAFSLRTSEHLIENLRSGEHKAA